MPNFFSCILKFVLICSILFLTACGGGGSSSSSDVDPTGIWVGTGGSTGSVGIITATNDVFFINSAINSLTSGRVISVTGNSVSGNARSYATIGNVFSNGAVIVDGTFTSTITAKQSFNGTYTSVLGDNSFTYSYDAAYDRNSSLSAVSGFWSGSDFAGDLVQLTFNNNGAITGFDSSGCLYSGLVSLIDPNNNAYSLSITISDCGAFTATYSGIASLGDTSITNDTLITAFSTPTTALVLPLRR